ncbi:hypothetical protein Bbelb_186320 [Branchiostoma belcheri]|nr:hypothetical protein Bbelb_186320 [Branchiostoma belcheri]
MLRVCEKLREADEKGRRYGLARAETDYLRALVDAMADTDRLAEVELLKTLGDMNVEKGRLGKDVGKFNTALALYLAAMVRCYHEEQADGIEHRYHYTERLLQGVSSQGKKQPTEDKETTTPAKVAEKFQALDKRRATGGNTDSLLVEYAQVMVEAIVNDNSILETEAIKSLGDVYLKRGTETGDTRNLTRATALYNRALARCHNVHGTVVIVHRLLHTAKIRQDIRRTRNKRPTPLQQQQDVRGQKGHFSPFSAAPSSDRTTSQVDDDISYHRYIQKADRDHLENGDLDAAEQNLAAALKLVHDRSKPNKAKEADCLCRLGDIYVKRGKQTGEGRKFTQAAALYNASMARTDGDKQNMVTKLQETERQFLKNTCNKDCEPCPYSSALDHRQELDNLRGRAKSQLETIHLEHNPYQYDEDDPIVRDIEIKRAEAIKNLFKSITVDRREFIQVLTDECIAKLGPPPCKYAFIGLGSQATELVTPYSDLEFATLIEEGKDDDDDTRRYFLNLTHYLHLKIINLGETILPAMAIPSLNDFLSEDPAKDWFYDSVTPRGFAFDGFMPWASKTPFGRDKTKRKPPVGLIQTPAKLAEYQHLHIALAEGYHLSDILRRVTYLTGDESLVNEYTDRVSQSIDSSPVLSRLSARLILKDNIQQIENIEPTGQLMNVKKEIYRFPIVAVDVLSICCGITISSVWEMIEELHKTQRISHEDAHHLTVLISISAELRLRTYIANGGQKDRLSPLTEMKNSKLDRHDVDDTFVQSVFYIPDSKMLFRYYYTAIPLKKCIADTVAKENTTTKIFPTAIFDTSSLTKGRMTRQLLQLDASVQHLDVALEEAGSDEEKQFEIFFELGNVTYMCGDYEKAIIYLQRALSVGNTSYEDPKVHHNINIAALLANIGVCWSDLGDQTKAISYHEQSLKMRKAIYGETTEHPDIATSLDNIGVCRSDLGNQRKAISYYEQSLKMRKAIYGETKPHPAIASSLHNIGKCWSDLGDHRKAIWYYEQSLKMMKAIYGETTEHPDIATSLNSIGVCRSDLGDQRKAMSYYEQSLKMRKAIYGETKPHPDIASLQNNIGSCWTKLGDQRKAISYYEQSLEMMKAIYGETMPHPNIATSLNNIGTCWITKDEESYLWGTTPHPDIATSLNNIGACWSDLGDQRKAISYYEQSLEMRKDIYGETTPHPDIATSLNNIGLCWSDLGDQRKAISYHEQSLKMWKSNYGETKPHPNIASSLNNIGVCWTELGNQRKAISYYEQSLEMRKAIYGETTPHPDIASSLNNIGICWSDLGDHRKAISYHEQSLNMRKAIYGETKPHPDIATSLNNIGTCWTKLGDQRKAITYYEQSLEIMKAIYGETTEHPDIATSLNNIGTCWSQLGDQRKAISYYEQSLKMTKAIYGETTEHPDIAGSLSNIGTCWRELGDQRKAISYHEQSLKMRKAIYGETTPHPDIATSLNNIGTCWTKLVTEDEESYLWGNKPHPDIAGSLHNIGTCWSELGDQRKAISYHEPSLKMMKAIYGETTPHPDIASSLNNIGTCWSDLGDQRKAISYYEQSLEMRKAIYGETNPHPDIATSLNNIGACWHDLGDKRKAISYYEQSLKMMKASYGEAMPHPDIATSLNNIGKCWSDLGDQRKAIWYYEQSLNMKKAIYGETTEHPVIASSLNNIGACWSDLGDQRKAISYYEQSLKMRKAIYGETTPHPDIASLLNNIGKCWSDLGDQRKAISFYEQSLKMRKAIYGETTPHPNIASSLNNIGTCCSELGDKRKAISYHEQSLKMEKAIYGETKPHPNIASSLNNIGTCWSELGDQRKAISYYEQSLKMRKAIYGETTPHPDIASSLNNIGACWRDLGDHWKAISYHEQSLEMEKAIYGETTPHPNIAVSLNNIGNCWHELGEQKKAIGYHEQSLKMMKAIYGENTLHPNIAKVSAMLRVCEKLRELDMKGRRYGLARAETGYLRALVDAMADTDRLAEVELLKTLGDVNVEKGRLGKDVGKFNTALALYLAAMVRCYHEEQADGIEHRYHYTERLLQGVSSQGKKQPTEDKGMTTPAKVAEKFQALDKRLATGGNTDSLLVGYAQVMVEAIVNDNSMLETEAIKSLGDVYLKRGTETGDTRNLTRATALYNRALARCHNVHGTVVIVHRLLHTAKIRQDITRTRNKDCELGPSATKRDQEALDWLEQPTRLQQQQDVRGQKGHFSPLSAAPSRGRTTSQVDDDISYRRYIQMADRENGDLDAAEQNLAAALKLVHDRSKPNKAKEADCLCRLGDVYVERGKRTGEGRKFTQAAALYNASMARTDGDKQNMVTKLQETERQFLKNTCNLDCEPCPYSSALDHRKELDNLRGRAKSQLETIHREHNPYQYDEDDPVVREVETKRAEAIKNLFKSITVDRREFIQVLTDECMAKLGPPPCKYAFIGLGSQATELVTPYSDLEFSILIEEGKDDDDDTRRYFLNLTHYLHLKIINLGETILPAMAIPSLNDFLSEDPAKDWFYDSVTNRGFAFDGFMPWASKTPFGRDKTKSKPPVSLIQTPAKLAEYQRLHIALAEGYHLSDILRRVTYLAGDESLVNDYTDRVNQSIDSSPVLSRMSSILMLKDNIPLIKTVEPTGKLLNVKKEIYRFPIVAVDVLSICCGITISSVWGMIEELHKTQRISHEDAHHLIVLISISAELRLRTYIANGGQKDRLSPLTEVKNSKLEKNDVDDTFVQSVFYIPDSKMLFRYYYTAIPLKRCIADTVAKENTTTKIFPTAIFDTSSLTKGRITRRLLQLDASVQHLDVALEEAGSDEEKQFEILFELGNITYMCGDYEKAINYFQRALGVGNIRYEDTKVHYNIKIAALFANIGVCWSGLGDQTKALSYHEQSLKMTKAIYGETKPHPDIASSLNNIGKCWSELGDQKKAITYYEQSLEIMKAIYGETKPHPDIASSLNNIGICWNELGDQRKAIEHPDIASSLSNIGTCWSKLGDQRKAISYYEQSLKMMKGIYGETTPHPDIASSLNNIGACWRKLGDQRKAISYYEQSLEIMKSIYGETTPHPDIAVSLNNIGICWRELGNQRKAISYYEQSLEIKKAIYGKTTPHPDIATSLNNIGVCWSDLGNQRKAISYCEQSLEMKKAIYGKTTPHPDIATSLNNIGVCWSDLGDQRKAISYYEQSLEIIKAIYGETMPHPDIAGSLNNIGTCWSELGNQRKAISYYEQSLKMKKAIYGETTPHPDIAVSLNNIGACWSDLGDQRKAISYYEQSLEIMKAIYGETTPHPDIASSLNNIGTCWSELGNQRKAIIYYEQSLKMKKAIYGETTPHPDIAVSLNNIGNCWRELGKQKEAISYYEQSLKMWKSNYGETMPHPNIALSLHNIGKCWSDLGDQRKAISYYEQSLKMRKAIYGETTPHPDIASSLNNIGTCWSDLGDQRKAISYYEQSLKMRKAIYGETTPHPDIASSLNNIGTCWSELGNQRKAITYYEQSLEMKKAIYGETKPHPDIASSLNNIGVCWRKLGDHWKAISYYEQSLKMMKAIYGETTPHPDIAGSLNNIGACWSDLGNQRKAISFHEQSLEMKKAIYGKTTPHPDIASSLNNIGVCWSKLGDQRKAISYHEQSLEMKKAIYGETTPHPDIAGSLNNIGNCWRELGEQKEAISYYEQSLKMMKAIYGENTLHPNIAASLSNIGACWEELGDDSKARWYWEQSQNK